jgi:uncharacterized membrane protein
MLTPYLLSFSLVFLFFSCSLSEKCIVTLLRHLLANNRCEQHHSGFCCCTNAAANLSQTAALRHRLRCPATTAGIAIAIAVVVVVIVLVLDLRHGLTEVVVGGALGGTRGASRCGFDSRSISFG